MKSHYPRPSLYVGEQWIQMTGTLQLLSAALSDESTLGSLSFKQYGPRSDRAVCKGFIFFAFMLEVVWIALKYIRLLSLSHTEHIA